MEITYPRPMLCGVQTRAFGLARFEARNLLAGGTTQTRELADQRWRAELTYAPMGPLAFQALDAWLDSLDVGRLFLCHDPLRPYPISYAKAQLLALTRAGGGAFDGTATVTALSAAGFTLGTLPPGLVLKAGDMVGLVQAGRYGLFRILEDVTTSAGGLAALPVRPRVSTALFTTAAAGNLVRPACTMFLDPAPDPRSRTAGQRAPISFSALQSLA